MREVIVDDSSSPFSIKTDQVRIKGYSANLLVLNFHLSVLNFLVTILDDCSVLLYKVTERGLTEYMTQEI